MYKTLLLLLGCISLHFFSFNQVKISGNDKADIILIQKELKHNNNVPSNYLLQRFPIHKLNNNYYISILGKVNSEFSKENIERNGAIFGSKIGNIVSLKVPVNNILNSLENSGIIYIELGMKVRPNLDKAVKDVRADSVQNGWGLPQSFTGRNVLIGITDWGFDYTHPMFYDTLLNQSRILAAWDQYKTSGPAPSGYTYGTEYDSPQELLNAESDTANIYSYALHGSHVAGICGGSGATTAYRGVAFDARYLFATFLVDNASVLDAYAWMYQKAQQEQQRLVINMSWGLYHMGTLDGNSLLSQAIDNYSDLGVVFCNSAGNNGGVSFHIKKDFQNDTIQSKINFYQNSSLNTLWGQSISMWGEAGNSFSAKIKVLNNFNQEVNTSPFYSTLTTTNYIDSFLVVGTDTVYFNISADNQHPANGKPQMRLRVRTTDYNLKVVLCATADQGIVHFWNVTELTSDVGNWGESFSTINSTYTAGDDSYGISEPACTKSLITVAAYASEYYTTNGQLTGGTIASFSSKGPTIDERMKPDVSAPGVNVASSISSFTDNSFTQLTSVDFNGRSYPFGRLSGTSMACPMTTGVVALILEANPQLSSQQVKDILISTAREDLKTGDIPDTGSVRWGWGKIHAWRAVQMALETEKVQTLVQTNEFLIYPNPANTQVIIERSNTTIPCRIEVYSTDGKLITNKELIANNFDVSELKEGIYLLRIISSEQSFSIKFQIQR